MSNAVSQIIAAGYPCFMTEFGGGVWGTGVGGLDAYAVADLERLGVSWLTFQYIPPTGVSDDVTDPKHYTDIVNWSGLSWTPDYGNWPPVRGPYGNGGYPWTTPDYNQQSLDRLVADSGGKFRLRRRRGCLSRSDRYQSWRAISHQRGGGHRNHERTPAAAMTSRARRRANGWNTPSTYRNPDVTIWHCAWRARAPAAFRFWRAESTEPTSPALGLCPRPAARKTGRPFPMPFFSRRDNRCCTSMFWPADSI